MGRCGMKVRFNGMITKNGGGGCIPCGKHRKSSSKLSYTVQLSLPSGAFTTFMAGQEYEVKSIDADYLLKHGTIKIGSEEKPVFEVV